MKTIKERFNEINNTLHLEKESVFLYCYRKLSIIFVCLFSYTPITPNQITFLSFAFGIFAAIGFATGDKLYILLGGVFLQISMILDCADGLIARWKNQSSKFGAVFDIVLDVVKNNLIFLGIGIGLFIQTNNIYILFIPFIALFGVNMTIVAHNTQMMKFRDEPLRNSKLIQKMGKRSKFVKKYAHRFVLSGSFQFLVIGIGALLNKLIWSTVVIAVLQNIYWIGIMILMYINYRTEEKKKEF